MVGLLVGVVASMLPLSPASAHFLGEDSVDDGEIRFDTSTEQVEPLAHAIAVWNARGQIKITPDNIWNVQDLMVSDVDWPFDDACGAWRQSDGHDDIWINLPYFRPLDNDGKDSCMTHEWGHALGIDHNGDYNVMDADWTPTVETEPRCHDKEDYRTLWGGDEGYKCVSAPGTSGIWLPPIRPPGVVIPPR